jgi:acetate kinase
MAALRNKVVVLNAGSSSLKFKLFQRDGAELTAVAAGLCERIGDPSNSRLKARAAVTGAGHSRSQAGGEDAEPPPAERRPR